MGKLYTAFLTIGVPLTLLHIKFGLTTMLLKEKYWVIRPSDAIMLLHASSALSILSCALAIWLFLSSGIWIAVVAILASLLLAPFLTLGITLLYCEIAVNIAMKHIGAEENTRDQAL